MNNIKEKQIQTMFDMVMLDITKQYTGIVLCRRDTLMTGNVCTVYTKFEGEYSATVALCVDLALMTRLTQRVMQQDMVSEEDVEEFAKEYFNIICGRLVAGFFQITKKVLNFQIPSFYIGKYFANDCEKNWRILSYISDQNECAQFMCIT